MDNSAKKTFDFKSKNLQIEVESSEEETKGQQDRQGDLPEEDLDDFFQSQGMVKQESEKRENKPRFRPASTINN